MIDYVVFGFNIFDLLGRQTSNHNYEFGYTIFIVIRFW